MKRIYIITIIAAMFTLTLSAKPKKGKLTVPNPKKAISFEKVKDYAGKNATLCGSVSKVETSKNASALYIKQGKKEFKVNMKNKKGKDLFNKKTLNNFKKQNICVDGIIDSKGTSINLERSEQVLIDKKSKK